MLGSSQREKVMLISHELIFKEFQLICPRYLNVTDRWMDGQLAVEIPCSA